MGIADATATAGRHVFPYLVATDMFVDISVLRANLAPIASKLFRYQLGQPGKCALAKLRAGDADGYRVIRCDHDPVGYLGSARIGGGPLYAQHKGTAQRSRLLQESAT